MAHILVTGGAGYIGSHTVVEILNAGHQVTVVDNLCNSKPTVFDRIEQICRRRPDFFEGDIRDHRLLDELLAKFRFDAVVHFAGLKAVGESAQIPWVYYDNNVIGTFTLIKALRKHGPKRIIFSSSATVYGDPESVPIKEDAKLEATNPYGRTKLHVEFMLRDLVAADPDWKVSLLRYFNPVGAHPSGLIGEDPLGVPNNLMPYIAQVAVGRQPCLSIFGNNYPTVDGTGVRDYIHVVDLALGHLAAMAHLSQQQGLQILNLGTGQGYSVLQVLGAFESASGRRIPHQFAPRRQGDIASCFADPSLAQGVLNWRATRGLDEMCRDAWNWQVNNPEGYPLN